MKLSKKAILIIGIILIVNFIVASFKYAVNAVSFSSPHRFANSALVNPTDFMNYNAYNMLNRALWGDHDNVAKNELCVGVTGSSWGGGARRVIIGVADMNYSGANTLDIYYLNGNTKKHDSFSIEQITNSNRADVQKKLELFNSLAKATRECNQYKPCVNKYGITITEILTNGNLLKGMMNNTFHYQPTSCAYSVSNARNYYNSCINFGKDNFKYDNGDIKEATASTNPGIVSKGAEYTTVGPFRVTCKLGTAYFSSIKVNGNDGVIYVKKSDGGWERKGSSVETDKDFYIRVAKNISTETHIKAVLKTNDVKYYKSRMVLLKSSHGAAIGSQNIVTYTAYGQGAQQTEPGVPVTFEFDNNVGALTIIKKGINGTAINNVQYKRYRIYYINNNKTYYLKLTGSNNDGIFTITKQEAVENESNGTILTTDSNGRIVVKGITYTHNYYIKELADASNHETNYTSKILSAKKSTGDGKININSTVNSVGPLTTSDIKDKTKVTIYNDIKRGNLKVIKQDKDDSSVKLPNVTFRIKNKDLNKWLYIEGADSITNGNYELKLPTSESTAEANYKTNVSDATIFKTNSSGEFTIGNLEKGEYEIREVRNPHYGYTNKIAEFSGATKVSDTCGKTSVEANKTKTVTLGNIKNTGNLELTKFDYDTEKRLAGVKFKLKNSDGSYVKITGGTGNFTNNVVTGNIVISSMETDEVSKNNATTFVTDSNGEIKIINILVDTYTVEETDLGDNSIYDLDKEYIYWSSDEGETKYKWSQKDIAIEVDRQSSKNTKDSDTTRVTKLYIYNRRKYIKISGNVWEDKIIISKVSSGNNRLDEEDNRINGIKVNLKDSKTGEIIQTTYTEEYTIDGKKINGHYCFEKVEILKLSNNYYIEFEYDGEIYTTVKDYNTLKAENEEKINLTGSIENMNLGDGSESSDDSGNTNNNSNNSNSESSEQDSKEAKVTLKTKDGNIVECKATVSELVIDDDVDWPFISDDEEEVNQFITNHTKLIEKSSDNPTYSDSEGNYSFEYVPVPELQENQTLKDYYTIEIEYDATNIKTTTNPLNGVYIGENSFVTIEGNINDNESEIIDSNPNDSNTSDSNVSNSDTDEQQYVISEDNKATLKIKAIPSDETVLEKIEYVLEGAIYQISDDTTDIIKKVTTDSNGEITLTVPAGTTYHIKQIEPSSGFKIDENVYDITLENGDEKVVTSTVIPMTEQELEEYEQAHLQPDGYVITDENRATMAIKVVVDEENIELLEREEYSIEGSVFMIYDDRTDVVKEYTTNENGEISPFDVPAGKYYIREIIPSAGFKNDENTYQLTLDPGDEKTVEITGIPMTEEELLQETENNENEGNGSEGGQPSSNIEEDNKKAEISIKKVASEELISDKNNNTLEGATYQVRDMSGKVQGTLVTDANGETEIIHVSSGAYRIRETVAPKGYNLDTKVYTVIVSDNDIKVVVCGESTNQNNSDTNNTISLEGVKVSLINENNEVIASTLTNKDGEYSLNEVILSKVNVYKVKFYKEGVVNKTKNLSDLSYEYTLVEREKTEYEVENTSKVLETAQDRSRVNNSYGSVSGTSSVNINESGNSSQSMVSGESGNFNVNYSTYLEEYDDASSISKNVELFESQLTKETKTRDVKNFNGYENYDINKIVASTKASNYNLLNGVTISDLIKSGVEEIENLNCGLKIRTQINLSVAADITNLKMSVNGYTHTYNIAKGDEYEQSLHENGNVIPAEENFRLKVKKQDLGRYRTVYASDIIQNSNDTCEILVTYKMTIINNSLGLSAKVHELANYHNKNYHIVKIGSTNNLEGDIKYTEDADTSNDKYSVSYFSDIPTIKPLEMQDIYVQYKLDNNAILEILSGRLTLENIIEINSYTTYDGGAVYASIDYNSAPGNLIIDNKSTYEDDTMAAPPLIMELTKNERTITGNVFEDVTSDGIQNGEIRSGDGIYQETVDKKVENAIVELYEYKEPTSYTKYQDVTMNQQKESSILTNSVSDNVASVWVKEKPNDSYIGNSEDVVKFGKTIGKKIEAKVKTNKDGYYSITGIMPGNYVLKYTYGDGSVIWKDNNKVKELDRADYYKSTIIVSPVIKRELEKNPKSPSLWYIETETEDVTVDGIHYRTSDAADDVEAYKSMREIQTYNYERQEEIVNNEEEKIKTKSAYTAPFNLRFEFISDQLDKPRDTSSVEQTIITNSDGSQQLETVIKYNIPNIDFGIVQRAKQDYEVEKEISNVKFTAQDGKIYVNGNPKDGLRYVRYKTMWPFNRSNAVDMEIQNEVLTASTLEATYDIKATNRSETNYLTYDYYYYGTIPSTEQDRNNSIETLRITKLIDYLDNGLNYINDKEDGNEEENEITTGKVKNNQIILDNGKSYEASEYLKENVIKNAEKYVNIIFFENSNADLMKPNDSSKVWTYKAQKLLEPDDSLEFVNYIEILEIGSSSPVSERNHFGNFDPKPDPVSEVDNMYPGEDDYFGGVISITGPTGGNRSAIAYIITALGLIAIAGGVIIIKKQIL